MTPGGTTRGSERQRRPGQHEPRNPFAERPQENHREPGGAGAVDPSVRLPFDSVGVAALAVDDSRPRLLAPSWRPGDGHRVVSGEIRLQEAEHLCAVVRVRAVVVASEKRRDCPEFLAGGDGRRPLGVRDDVGITDSYPDGAVVDRSHRPVGPGPGQQRQECPGRRREGVTQPRPAVDARPPRRLADDGRPVPLDADRDGGREPDRAEKRGRPTFGRPDGLTT